ncbi:hypothetical protein RJ639_006854 [Escallonia herrerae]|uniref:Uncharacterized protein n=1 Tax=Escallonia herrerae TaxID=1293975 RepID=A0AA88VTL1_9ASTE|nr:hypothetical protein RJ639_006854 [Escallonia herrerae]
MECRNALKADHAPIYIVFGMIMVAVSIGAHTAKQQLAYSPAVKVSKKKRESVPEVDQPEAMVGSSDKFINKSFLRKVGHIQDPASRTLPDPTRPDPFTCSRDVETLQSVGVSRGGSH